MFKPVIYVICNKYEFLNFNFKQKFVEKKLINVINTNKCKCTFLNIEMELPIYDRNEDQT